MQRPPTTTDVRIWDLEPRAGKRGTTYRLRWRTSRQRHGRTFSTKKLGDSYRSQLAAAASRGESFEIATGLPVSMAAPAFPSATTWLTHATEYIDMKWPDSSARHRRGMAEALMNITVALTIDRGNTTRPAASHLRQALMTYTFNTSTRRASERPDDFAEALRWIEKHSLPLAEIADPINARRAIDAVSRRLDGTLAAPSTIARKRATLTNALHHAVERGHFTTNPLDGVRTPRRTTVGPVDRRVVVNPEQARSLLDAVRERHPALECFFATIYFAGLRPAEARELRLQDCRLPEKGWGTATLAGSRQWAGSAWTDDGTADERRSLKHRHATAVREVPLHPELVATLTRHVRDFGTGVGGRLFVTRTGKAGRPLPPPYANAASPKTIYRVWADARLMALTPEQVASPLGKRPYDLRHACLSTWLNASVPPAQVAEWAGHGTDVLLRVYAKCIDGEAQTAMQRIESAILARSRSGSDHAEPPRELGHE